MQEVGRGNKMIDRIDMGQGHYVNLDIHKRDGVVAQSVSGIKKAEEVAGEKAALENRTKGAAYRLNVLTGKVLPVAESGKGNLNNFA